MDFRRQFVGKQIRRSDRVIPHPEYNQKDPNFQTRNDHDIALIILIAPFEETDFVRPVCLPQADFHIRPTAECIASGWGEDENGKIL